MQLVWYGIIVNGTNYLELAWDNLCSGEKRMDGRELSRCFPPTIVAYR